MKVDEYILGIVEKKWQPNIGDSIEMEKEEEEGEGEKQKVYYIIAHTHNHTQPHTPRYQCGTSMVRTMPTTRSR